MNLDQVLEQRTTVTVTAQLVLSQNLLRLSWAELDRAIESELAENPLLERQSYPFSSPSHERSTHGFPANGTASHVPSRRIAPTAGRMDRAPGGDGDLEMLISRVPAETVLADYVLQQVQLELPPEEMPIAAYLANSLDGRGFLSCDMDEVRDHLQVSRDRLERVVVALQGVNPPGIAARDYRECLLIQLKHLSGQGVDHALAERLILDHWEALSRCEIEQIAEVVGVTLAELREALRFIRDNLTPFPVQAAWGRPQTGVTTWQDSASILSPNVIIRECFEFGQESYKIEVPEEDRYRLRINSTYVEEIKALGRDGSRVDQGWEEWESLYARARWVIQGLEQRWQTLREVTRHLVDYQEGYLANGDRSLRPLTRAELAEWLGVHESTVSRAVAEKYAQLPDGRIVPLAKFFDSTASVKAALKELIEKERNPLSDREIAERLAGEGYDVSRRTVAKYRNALGIPPSTARRRIKGLQMALRRDRDNDDG